MAMQNGIHPSQNNGGTYRGQPPAKKPRSNPIITRYPPPPGYKGPAQPQPPYQGYGYGQQSYGGYQKQPPYTAPPQPWQAQWSGYPPQAAAPPAYPAAPTYFQSNAQYPSQPQSASPQPWQPPAPNNLKRRHDSVPNAHSRHVSFGPLDGMGNLLPPQVGHTDDDGALEHEFDSECYFARHPDEIDPDLSIGLIDWHAPLPTKLALPATFQEAELEALAPRQPRSDDEPSISEYFTKERVKESLLSVRQTPAWEQLQHDLIYREFSKVCKEYIKLSDLIKNYRNRPDPSWEQRSSYSDSDAGEAMAVDAEEQGDILGGLEQALAGDMSNGPTADHQTSTAGYHYRTASISSSTAGERITRPKPLAPVRDQAQEDLLAALGVTGSPKMVYQTPGPAFGAPPPGQNIEDRRTLSRHNSITSNTSHQQNITPPKIRVVREGNGDVNGSRPSTAGSAYDPDATPRPKTMERTLNRKRSHSDLEDRDQEDYYRGDEDATPRQRFKHARVDGRHD